MKYRDVYLNRTKLYVIRQNNILLFYLEEFYNQFSLRIISKLFWRGTITYVFLACGSDPSCQVIE